jgi:F0F1-type ATP synthase assembly protein I
MNSLPYESREHLPVGLTALYAGSDLPWTVRLKIKAHLRHCETCGRQVDSFRAAAAELRKEAEANTLTGFEAIVDWSRLEHEMIGNIAVGVAAGRCVDKVRHKGAFWLHTAFTLGLGALFVAGWITHIPREETDHVLASVRHWAGMETAVPVGTILRSSPEGVLVRSQGATLTLMHPRSAVTSISGASAVEARYIDEETGQVTITGVYGQ